MTTANDVTTVRLPHTGIHVPDRSLTVTGYKQHKTTDGVAFNAKLRFNNRIVGTIENHGTGGMTFFYPDKPVVFGEVHLEEYITRCRTAEGQPLTLVETLLDELVEEADWVRKVKRAGTKGETVLRLMDASIEDMSPYAIGEWGCTMPKSDTQWAQLSREIMNVRNGRPAADQWWQGWTGEAWIDVTARPKHVNPELYG